MNNPVYNLLIIENAAGMLRLKKEMVFFWNRTRYFVMSRSVIWYVRNKEVVEPGALPSMWKKQWRG